MIHSSGKIISASVSYLVTLNTQQVKLVAHAMLNFFTHADFVVYK